MDPAEYYSYGEPPAKDSQAPAAVIPPIAIPVDDVQQIKLVQQGVLDTERSLTQLAKVDVILLPQSATHERPTSVCCEIRLQGIELYDKKMPVVPDWFTPGTDHYWYQHFIAPREDSSTITWYRVLGWVKAEWPLPPLEELIRGGESRSTEPDLELKATDPGPADVDRT